MCRRKEVQLTEKEPQGCVTLGVSLPKITDFHEHMAQPGMAEMSYVCMPDADCWEMGDKNGDVGCVRPMARQQPKNQNCILRRDGLSRTRTMRAAFET